MIAGYPLGQDAYPSRLLDDYLAVARLRPRAALPATALRTGSLAARLLLAHAASGGTVSLADLVDAARRQPKRLPAARIDLRALANLARVIGLQDLLADDQSDALALYELADDLGGSEALPPEHQAMHAQLAFQAGDRARAAALLAGHRRIPEQTARDLRIDLANPFALGGSGAAECDWWRAFRRLLPEPYPSLAPGVAAPPFDRLASDGCPRIDGGDRISVIVTTYQPGAELLTAVRSLAAQSWTNLEIVLVDDASPPEHDLILKQCLELDPRVRLVRLDTNRGTYVARNAGIEAATGPYLTFQDSDDWSHPRRLEVQIRPLLEDPSVRATVTDGLRVTDQLVITRPGRQRHLMCPSSLTFHKETLVGRIGYFDRVRKGADSEYLARIETVFGADALRHDRSASYTIRRLSEASLSLAEFRAGWMHPARAAYKSAYHLWHQQIREGSAAPYVPVTPPRRPFAAPAHLRRAASEPGRLRHYDVVVVGDWRPLGQPADSMVEQVRALVRRGLRVGVAHLETFRIMAKRHQHLRRPIQELINQGAVTQILLPDEAEASLVLLHHPPALQFPPSQPCRLRSQRTLIVADLAPSDLDGAEHQYTPQTCTHVASAMFGAEPVWCPQGQPVRDRLASELPRPTLVPFDLPGVVVPSAWWTDRDRFRLDRPVIGRHLADGRNSWPGDRDTLLAIYPDSTDLEVRVLGGVATARTVLGTDALPPNWVVYDEGDLSVRSFLNQIDFYVYFPHQNAADVPGRTLLEALAAGCVAILPHQFAGTFGDAATYCQPCEVRDIVRALRADRTAYRAHSERAREWVRAFCGPEPYADLISSLIAGSEPSLEHRRQARR